MPHRVAQNYARLAQYKSRGSVYDTLGKTKSRTPEQLSFLPRDSILQARSSTAASNTDFFLLCRRSLKKLVEGGGGGGGRMLKY